MPESLTLLSLELNSMIAEIVSVEKLSEMFGHVKCVK